MCAADDAELAHSVLHDGGRPSVRRVLLRSVRVR